MSNRSAAVLLAVLLLICGLLSWRIWVLTSGELTGETPLARAPAGDDGAASAFVEAWRRNETAEYIAFVDVGLRGNGVAAGTEDIIVQRNGERLINRDNSIIYERDGQTETCRQTFEELFCTPPAPVSSLADREADLRTLFFDEDWSYRVRFATEVGCFDLKLDLSKGPLVPDYGLESKYCFDAATDALKSRVTKGVNRTETYSASDISDVPEESELRGVFPEAILDRFFQ